MSQLSIVAHGDAAAVLLPPALLETLGVGVGGVIHWEVTEGRVTLESPDAAARRHEFEHAADEVFRQWDGALRRLA